MRTVTAAGFPFCAATFFLFSYRAALLVRAQVNKARDVREKGRSPPVPRSPEYNDDLRLAEMA